MHLTIWSMGHTITAILIKTDNTKIKEQQAESKKIVFRKRYMTFDDNGKWLVKKKPTHQKHCYTSFLVFSLLHGDTEKTANQQVIKT